MKRCYYCQGKFGMIRHYIGRLQFCSLRHKLQYQKERDEYLRKKSFYLWLFSGPPKKA